MTALPSVPRARARRTALAVFPDNRGVPRRPLGRRAAAGFTLLDLLIVFTVVGILISLIVPAVQAAREAARRTTCQNNLKQLVAALQSYHTHHGCFPPASTWSPAGEPRGQGTTPIGMLDRVAMGLAPSSEPDRLYANWAVLLLPELGQGALYDKYHPDLPVADPANATVRATPLAVMTCPSDAFNRPENGYERALRAGTTGNRYARGNYALNGGTNTVFPNGRLDPRKDLVETHGYEVQGDDFLTDNRSVLGSGVSGVNAALRREDFAQVGTAHMVVLDELRAGVHPLDVRGTWALGFIGASITFGHGIYHGTYSEDGGPNCKYIEADDIVGCAALRAAFGTQALGQQCMACAIKVDSNTETNCQANARSMHPGGVNVGLLDGAVHFVRDSVDPQVWQDLHSRRDRQLSKISF